MANAGLEPTCLPVLGRPPLLRQAPYDRRNAASPRILSFHLIVLSKYKSSQVCIVLIIGCGTL